MAKKTTEHNANKANGGKGYLLKANIAYDASTGVQAPVMNIDMLGNDGIFAILEDSVGSLLVDMNIAGVAVPGAVRNFTHEKDFIKITCNVDIWLNRFVNY